MPREKEGQADQEDSAVGDHTCQLCYESVAVEEDHIRGMCSSCGERRYHTDCIVRLMISKTKEVTNSAHAGKLKIYAQKRPAHQFEVQCGRCPLKTASGEDCPGHIVGAEQMKPQKPAPAAPPPPQPPPRGGRSSAQQAGNPAAPALPRAAKLRGAGSWTKQARPSPRATFGPAEPGALGASGELRDRLGVLLPAAGEPGAAGDKPKKQRRHGKAASTLRFAPSTRPDKLKLCSNWQDCRAHGCAFAHSQEELAARETEWEEQQRLEAKRREKEEADRQRASLEEEMLDWQARQQLGEHVGPLQEDSVLLMSEHAISLVKAFKHSYCINSLMEMGFDPASAQAASLATGAAVEAAAEVLALGALEGLSEPSREVDVSRELDRLLATASLMCATAADVEAQLQAFGGNWEAAEATLLQRAGGGAEARGAEGHTAGAAAAQDGWAAGFGAAADGGASAATAMRAAVWEQTSSFGAATPGAAAAAHGGAAAFDSSTSWAVSEDFGLPMELAAPVATGYAGAGTHSSSVAATAAGGQYGSTPQHSAAFSQLAIQVPGELSKPAPFTAASESAPALLPPATPTPAIAAAPTIVPPLGAPDPEGGSASYQAWVQEAMARLGLQGSRAEAAGGMTGGPAASPGAASEAAVGTGAQQPLGSGAPHVVPDAGRGDVDWAAVLGGGEVAPAGLAAGLQPQQAEQAPALAAAPAVSAVGLDWSATKQPAQFAMRAVAGQQQAVPEQQDTEDLQNMLALLCGT